MAAKPASGGRSGTGGGERIGGGAGPDPLVIRSLEFLGGQAQPGGWRPETALPEVAFAGRSNVGKSSLLNTLVRRKTFARVSGTPGKTREINYFEINRRFLLVDLPGYGYARVSKERRAEWRPLIESYIRGTPQLRGVVQLLDVRHDPTVEDQQMFEFLADVGTPTLVAATKIDKLTRAQAAERIRAITSIVGLEEEQVIPFSSVTGVGRDELAEAIAALVEPDPEDPARAPGTADRPDDDRIAEDAT
jgi:GTP-binding protein